MNYNSYPTYSYQMPVGNQSMYDYRRPNRPGNPNRPGGSNDDRLVGGFLGPFILGGITGGLLAPAFYPRPYYYNNYYYPPYYYYRPY
ncbi:MAG: hypothetical protein KH135_05500 [Firmicutes bacterium]|nr:hypothetical protein [Bacillota bacterium]